MRSAATAWGAAAVLAGLAGAAGAEPPLAPPDAPAAAVGASYRDRDGCLWQGVEIGTELHWAPLIGPDGSGVCDPALTAQGAAAAPAPVQPAAAEAAAMAKTAAEVRPDQEDAPAETASVPEGPVLEVQGSPADTAEALAPAGAPAAAYEPAPPGAATSKPAEPMTAPAVAAPGPANALAATPEELRPIRPVREASWRKAKRRPEFPEPGQYLQIGAFAEPANADRTSRALQELGYDVLKQDFPNRGGRLRVLYAGPFPDRPAADAARRAARSLGFPDAFIWDQQ